MATNGVRMQTPEERSATFTFNDAADAYDNTALAEPYIDFIKLGFGTALFTLNLERKLAVYRNSRIAVFCGETLFEAFVARNQLDDYFRFLERYKIEYVEVSDGSFPLPLQKKCEYIRKLARHFGVLSEVGSKDENVELTPEEWIEGINSELEAGARNVITEARESGSVGIYGLNGEVREELTLQIVAHVPKDKVIWEAPMKSQQIRFINGCGSNINLGNIAPDDVIPLETLRCGLRGGYFLYVFSKSGGF
jgi:phosphosulfolactate synthase